MQGVIWHSDEMDYLSETPSGSRHAQEAQAALAQAQYETASAQQQAQVTKAQDGVEVQAAQQALIAAQRERALKDENARLRQQSADERAAYESHVKTQDEQIAALHRYIEQFQAAIQHRSSKGIIDWMVGSSWMAHDESYFRSRHQSSLAITSWRNVRRMLRADHLYLCTRKLL